MIREIGPRKRFTIILLFIHALALPVISGITYMILRENAVADAYEAGKLYLSSVGAMKQYVGEQLRPVFYREMPERFIVEGMSRSYVASRIAAKVRRELPNYIYKNASLSPKNPLNSADEFERMVILDFAGNRAITEWKGFHSKHEGRYYVVARPGEPFEKDCLRCHGDPDSAPEELTAVYGRKAGFHMTPGEIADATFVYIPISVPLASARKAVAVFAGIYAFAAVILVVVIRGRFAKLYDVAERDRKRLSEINLELVNLNRDMESIISERTMNLVALSVADRVRNPASVIAGTLKRILKKEDCEGPVRERISTLISEAQKLENIVKDYENILKSRHTVFGVEDLNSVVANVLGLIESERTAKHVDLCLRLADSPLMFMANRQFLQVALHQVLKNAVEAAPEYGEIAVESWTQGNSVILTISNNGSGIAEDKIPLVFSLFYSTKQRRMGMGLPLVKEIVEEHKGTVTIESDAKTGTTVTIVFPARWSESELLTE